jgi:hypothetical protein
VIAELNRISHTRFNQPWTGTQPQEPEAGAQENEQHRPPLHEQVRLEGNDIAPDVGKTRLGQKATGSVEYADMPAGLEPGAGQGGNASLENADMVLGLGESGSVRQANSTSRDTDMADTGVRREERTAEAGEHALEGAMERPANGEGLASGEALARGTAPGSGEAQARGNPRASGNAPVSGEEPASGVGVTRDAEEGGASGRGAPQGQDAAAEGSEPQLLVRDWLIEHVRSSLFSELSSISSMQSRYKSGAEICVYCR